jgi:Sugar-transfer associated ATP-grasp
VRPSQPVLIRQKPKAGFDTAAALIKVARGSNRSALGVAADLFRAVIGRQQMRMDEFFIQGAWMGPSVERAAFVGTSANGRLNRSLIAPGPDDQSSLITDKFQAGLVLARGGFPVPMIKAVFAAKGSFADSLALRKPENLADWLSDPDNLPAFAKPIGGAMALGSVPIFMAGPGKVDIGGQTVEVATLAGEVAEHYPDGWLIQELLRQPPDIEALIGPAIGTVRLVTLWEASGPEVLYGVWRHPAPGTWVDSAIHGAPNTGCALDGEGMVIRAQLGDLFSGKAITQSRINPDLPLVGKKLEQWDEIVAIGRAAHRLFPGHALIGWDFAMTVQGPVIGEVNHNPLHMSYQRAFGRGFLHAEHRSRLDAARSLLSARCTGKGTAR